MTRASLRDSAEPKAAQRSVRSSHVRLALAWAPAVLTMGAIWVLSSMSHPPVSVNEIPFRDRGAHFLSFGSVAFWVAHGTFFTRPRVGVVRVVLFAILATGLWGLLDEVHQSFVPDRSPDVVDLFADTLGGIVGASLRASVRLVWPRRTGTPPATEGAPA